MSETFLAQWHNGSHWCSL